VFDLDAGYGVHIPLFAPHWVRNLDNVSVALSITYELHSVERSARVYRLNHKLRQSGLTPTPPGVSPWRDQLKLAALAAKASVSRAIREPQKQEPGYYPIWLPPAPRPAHRQG
jgi:hypothetical protein